MLNSKDKKWKINWYAKKQHLRPLTISRNLSITKKDINQVQKLSSDAYLQIKDGNGLDKKENNKNMAQTMWKNVLHLTKF